MIELLKIYNRKSHHNCISSSDSPCLQRLDVIRSAADALLESLCVSLITEILRDVPFCLDHRRDLAFRRCHQSRRALTTSIYYSSSYYFSWHVVFTLLAAWTGEIKAGPYFPSHILHHWETVRRLRRRLAVHFFQRSAWRPVRLRTVPHDLVVLQRHVGVLISPEPNFLTSETSLSLCSFLGFVIQVAAVRENVASRHAADALNARLRRSVKLVYALLSLAAHSQNSQQQTESFPSLHFPDMFTTAL